MDQRQRLELAVVAAVELLDLCVFRHSALMDVVFVECQFGHAATKLTGQLSALLYHKTLSLTQLLEQDGVG
jgi:hypothetical protein